MGLPDRSEHLVELLPLSLLVSRISADINDMLAIQAIGCIDCYLPICANCSDPGQPARCQIFSLDAPSAPTAAKSFYKVQKVTMKWNNVGSALLVLAVWALMFLSLAAPQEASPDVSRGANEESCRQLASQCFPDLSPSAHDK